MTFEELWVVEETLWLGGKRDYAAILHPDALMAFAKVGLLGAATVAESIEGQRWTSVSVSDGVLKQVDHDLIVLGYRAKAAKQAEAPYQCVCTSTYARANGQWRLIQHQQSAET
jgi:hypothetical protein